MFSKQDLACGAGLLGMDSIPMKLGLTFACDF